MSINMKRLWLIVAFIFITLSLNAQSIKYRRLLDPDGLSVMTTSLEVFPWGERKIEYALQYEVAPIEGMHQGYYLNVYFTENSSNDYVPAGGRLLIRTTNNNVISLTDCGDKYFREYNPELNIHKVAERSTSFYDKTFNTVRYTVHGKYPISEEDLALLMKEGAIKIRIETTGEALECSYKEDAKKKNKTADVITKLYNTLVKETDLYYGI